jgi:hypothetical protein
MLYGEIPIPISYPETTTLNPHHHKPKGFRLINQPKVKTKQRNNREKPQLFFAKL